MLLKARLWGWQAQSLGTKHSTQPADKAAPGRWRGGGGGSHSRPHSARCRLEGFVQIPGPHQPSPTSWHLFLPPSGDHVQRTLLPGGAIPKPLPQQCHLYWALGRLFHGFRMKGVIQGLGGWTGPTEPNLFFLSPWLFLETSQVRNPFCSKGTCESHPTFVQTWRHRGGSSVFSHPVAE